MDLSAILLGAGVGLTSGLLLLARLREPGRRIRRALRAVKAQPIAQVTPGRVAKIAGTIAAVVDEAGPLRSPLGGRACAYYCVVVERNVGSSDGANWREVVREEARRDFRIVDESGEALVRLDGAQVGSLPHLESSAVDEHQVRAALYALLSRQGSGELLDKTLRWREAALEIGERVAVGGPTTNEPDPHGRTGGYRDAPSILVLQGRGALPLLVSDDPKAL